MSKDALPPHPRIWWDGRDFLWLQDSPGQEPPELYRADTVEDIIAMAEGPAVELHVAVPPAEVRYSGIVRHRGVEAMTEAIAAKTGVEVEVARIEATVGWDALAAAGLLTAEPTGCAEQVPGCTRQRSHRHTPIDVRDPTEPTGGTPADFRWWLSWYDADPFEYAGPWWITGSEVGSDGFGRATICAAVIAPTEDAARALIAAAHDDPAAAIEWRFVEERPADWSPFCARFPRSEWMRWPTAGTS